MVRIRVERRRKSSCRTHKRDRRQGFEKLRYRIVWLDTWWLGARDANGNIVVDSTRWPHGMAGLASYIHAKGFLAGIYTDAGAIGCHSGGSYGHYQQDVNQFAAWGFDAVKVDFCGGPALHLDPSQAFGAFARAIRDDQPHRPMILNICNPALWWVPYQNSALDTWSFGPKIATSWRTSTDLSFPVGFSFAHLLRNIDADAAHPEVAGNGRWNDPDYLAPSDLPSAEARAQFTMWAVLAAPMVVSADVSQLPAATIAMLTNPEAVAISQDRLGIQGTLVAHRGQVQFWVKPLADGSEAVAILNRGTGGRTVAMTASMIGLHGNRLRVRDVWYHRTTHARRFKATVGPASALLLRVWSR